MNTKESFFNTLWTRMSQQGDFPSLQFSVDRLVNTINSDADVNALAASVLADFSLSQKVLRLANSAMYSSFGGEVTTISRAIMVLGAEAVRHLALSLELLDNFAGAAAKHPQAGKELKRAIMSGEIARALSVSQKINDGEEAVVCTLMHHLSRMLLVFYFPHEWGRIQSVSETLAETEACQTVLGVSLEEIAYEAAKRWRMPDVLTATMTRNTLEVGAVAADHANWLGAMAEVSTQAATVMNNGGSSADVRALLGKHSETLGIESSAVDAATSMAMKLFDELNKSEAGQAAPATRPAEGKPKEAAANLRKHIKEVRDQAFNLSIAALAPLVTESMLSAMNLTNCCLFLSNPATKRFVARVGFGRDMLEKLPRMNFDGHFVPDVFHLAATSSKQIFIADSHTKEIAPRIPKWYRDEFPLAKSLILLPIMLNGRCVALMYGDWGPTGCASISNEELAGMTMLIKEMENAFIRNQTRQEAKSA